jgi:hypothetical protein
MVLYFFTRLPQSAFFACGSMVLFTLDVAAFLRFASAKMQQHEKHEVPQLA